MTSRAARQSRLNLDTTLCVPFLRMVCLNEDVAEISNSSGGNANQKRGKSLQSPALRMRRFEGTTFQSDIRRPSALRACKAKW